MCLDRKRKGKILGITRGNQGTGSSSGCKIWRLKRKMREERGAEVQGQRWCKCTLPG